MNILAVYPQEPELAVFEKMPPLGMLWIAAVLRRAGHSMTFIDEQVDESDPASLAAELQPPLALIGGTSHSRFRSFAVAERIKEASPETTIIYGGPHASFTAEDSLLHVPSFDIVVHGEGEHTCIDLVEWVAAGGQLANLSKIPGISFRKNGSVERTAPRTPIADLDSLGDPARDLVPLDRYEMKMDYIGLPGGSIMTARGCPIACTFCSASAMFGRSYRTRTPARVVDEIESLIKDHGVQGIKIFDSTLTLRKSHVEALCDELARRGIHVPWECEIRVGTVDKRLLAKMQENGCYYVDVGVESGSQRVLDECVQKRITLEAAEDLLRWTSELGLLTKVFFTVGHPGETWQEARSTNRFIWRNRRNIRLAAFQAGVKVYPGTAVETYALEHNLLPSGFRWSAPYQNLDNKRLFRSVDNIPLLLQPQMGVRELRKIRLQFIAMRVSSPRFVREKIAAILKARTLKDYLAIIGRGVGLAKRRPLA